MQNRREHRALDGADNHVVHPVGRLPVEPAEIFVERLLDTSPDFVGAIQTHDLFHAARASSTHGVATHTAGAYSSRSACAASRSKNRFTAAICAADVSTRLTSCRNASPPASPAAYQPRCLRATRTALRCSRLQPVRILSVTGTSTAATTASRIALTSDSLRKSAEPAATLHTFFAGQPMLMSTICAPRSTL